MGIEPTAQAWEAWVLPLYDARVPWILVVLHATRQMCSRTKERRLEGVFPNRRGGPEA